MIAAYAEYDAVPGNTRRPSRTESRATGVHERRRGTPIRTPLSGWARSPGCSAAKAAMERHGLAGTLVFFGEPAEKVCGSKPVHAAHGYYDDLDAAISFHPAWVPLARQHRRTGTRTAASYWSTIYTFECPEPETGRAPAAASGRNPHTIGPRARRHRRGRA